MSWAVPGTEDVGKHTVFYGKKLSKKNYLKKYEEFFEIELFGFGGPGGGFGAPGGGFFTTGSSRAFRYFYLY